MFLRYLDYIHKNIHSIKYYIKDEFKANLKTYISNKTHNFFHKVVDLKYTIYINKIGKFSYKSLSGN